MARPIKSGFQRFSVEVHIFEDIKIRKIIRYKGAQGTLVYIKLLCMAYENGYFVKWDSELPFVISEATGLEESYVLDVIQYLIEIGLFNEPMFNLRGILTSSGIQDRYSATCKNLKRSTNIDPHFAIVSTEETRVNTEETPVIPEETPVIPEESTQERKVKILLPSKDDNNKKKRRENKSEFIPPSRADVGAYVLGLYPISSTAAEKFSDRFVSYYEANDWMVGKGSKKFKMKDWHKSITIQWKETVFEYADKYPEAAVFDKYNPPFVA